ncbi:hypothetical protein F5Y10DRAFT_174091 [Nemania abortiva]|nr:hypothetical protein F5Y10DRAFT_174091 [Nemania abortiva]
MSRVLESFKVGCTVAIFYPLAHAFLDGTVGVRVEEIDKVLILPLSLSEVLAMNKQVVEFVNRDSKPRKCHGCGEVKDKLDKCAQCGLFHYCNRTNGWGSHKKYCKPLKDQNVRKMVLLDYTTMEGGQVSFR